jgi:general secretion pathway protein G
MNRHESRVNVKRRRPHRRRAFTLIEVIVVVIIIGVLAAAIAPRLFQRVGQSKQAVARNGAASLATSMSMFLVDTGKSIDSVQDLTVLIERPDDVEEDMWQGPYLNSADDLLDPWGNEYVLVVPGEVNFDFDIVSYGSDGQPGGEGEAGDIINGQR